MTDPIQVRWTPSSDQFVLTFTFQAPYGELDVVVQLADLERLYSDAGAVLLDRQVQLAELNGKDPKTIITRALFQTSKYPVIEFLANTPHAAEDAMPAKGDL